jgi:hypothetical protein
VKDAGLKDMCMNNFLRRVREKKKDEGEEVQGQ